MAEDKTIEYRKTIFNPKYEFNANYGLSFLTQGNYDNLLSALSNLRRSGDIDSLVYHIARDIFRHHYENCQRIKYLDAQQPRLIAQKFIGKRKIREFIFKRDRMCLRCGTETKLTIDHIIPITKGGENKISNLQTLCKSCNSGKSNRYKDYRNGGR